MTTALLVFFFVCFSFHELTMKNFAIFRLPHADTYTEIIQHKGEPRRLASVGELNGQKGFVVAPFSATDDEPLLLIAPDEVKTLQLDTSLCKEENDIHDENERSSSLLTDENERSYYSVDFQNFHSRLVSGEFKKIVLARSAEVSHGDDVNTRRLFFKACMSYPRMFVALVSTKVTGTWLVATPEILLEGNGRDWHTMALAGTMTLGKLNWSEKNIAEQAYVTTYITECIERFTNNFQIEGPYSVRAGELVHLRTDFHFSIISDDALGKIIATLHPTPAVCGIPKRETNDFIIANEHRPRRYYSGFMGTIGSDGSANLYVSLRCMEICGNEYRLHAGGGLIADSEEESEWNETETKMQTIRRCFTRKIR